MGGAAGAGRFHHLGGICQIAAHPTAVYLIWRRCFQLFDDVFWCNWQFYCGDGEKHESGSGAACGNSFHDDDLSASCKSVDFWPDWLSVWAIHDFDLLHGD